MAILTGVGSDSSTGTWPPSGELNGELNGELTGELKIEN
jgi:hypothetical protein